MRRFGGTVIASSAQTSTHVAMPQATIDRAGAVDHVVPLDDLAAMLVTLTPVPVLGGDHADRPAGRVFSLP